MKRKAALTAVIKTSHKDKITSVSQALVELFHASCWVSDLRTEHSSATWMSTDSPGDSGKWTLSCEANTLLLVVVTLMRYDIQFVTQNYQKRDEKNANYAAWFLLRFSIFEIKILCHFLPLFLPPTLPCNVPTASHTFCNSFLLL